MQTLNLASVLKARQLPGSWERQAQRELVHSHFTSARVLAQRITDPQRRASLLALIEFNERQ